MDISYKTAEESHGPRAEVVRDAEGSGGRRGHSKDSISNRLDSPTSRKVGTGRQG